MIGATTDRSHWPCPYPVVRASVPLIPPPHPNSPRHDAGRCAPLLPSLLVATADPDSDANALNKLVDWCGRYTPFTAADGPDGIILDISGCAHLFCGEEGLLIDLAAQFKRMRLTARIAAADTPGAAWGWARYGADEMTIHKGGIKDAMLPLSVAALRLAPDVIERLQQLGLHRIRDIINLPRAPLARRCGMTVLDRLDRVLGYVSEPISPVRPSPEWRTRLPFVEPIGRAEDIAMATKKLLDDLCDILGKHNRGARQLTLVLYRVDGTTQNISIGTGQATRNAKHLYRLFTEKLGTADPGFGIEVMILEAQATNPLSGGQMGIAGHNPGHQQDLTPLIDRLRNRLGDQGVFRITPVASHIPERAVTTQPATAKATDDDWIADQPRPIRLLTYPEQIIVEAPAFHHPPKRFVWRRRTHQVKYAEGPERISPEWWRPDAGRTFRDYYRLEDQYGRRYWVFHDCGQIEITDMGWFMHGLFA